jgi:hypothetical protein
MAGRCNPPSSESPLQHDEPGGKHHQQAKPEKPAKGEEEAVQSRIRRAQHEDADDDSDGIEGNTDR